MPLEVLVSPRLAHVAQWIIEHTALKGLHPRLMSIEQRLAETESADLSVLSVTDKPSILVGQKSSDGRSYRLVMGLDVNLRSPMGQNSFQNFPRPVYCSLLGVPYVGMTPFADLVPKRDGRVALERISPLLFPAMNKLYELTHVPVALVPWPGSERLDSPILDREDRRLPDPQTPNSQGFFSIIDELIETLVVDRDDVANVRLETVVPWMRLLKELSPKSLPPLDRHSVELVPTGLVGWRTGMNGSFDWPLTEDARNRMESVVFHTSSMTVRHYPYAGSTLLWDFLLCRTGFSCRERSRNMVVHFNSVRVVDFLGKLPITVTVRQIERDVYTIHPGLPSLHHVNASIPPNHRLLVQIVDALVFADGWVLPVDLDVTATLKPSDPVRLALTRPVQSRYFVFTEGDDKPILQRMARFVGDATSLERPELEWRRIGGAGNWRRITSFPWSANALGEQVKVFLLLDRDYRTNEEASEIEQTLRNAGVSCHIWSRKEIENYFLVPDAIVLAAVNEIIKRKAVADRPSLMAEILSLFDQALEEQHSQTFGQLMTARLVQDRAREPNVAVEFHRTFHEAWRFRDYRVARVGGKDALRSINRLLQQRFGVSLTLDRILSQMTVDSLDPELLDVIRMVKNLGTDDS